jgi:N-methylhydantoinase B
MSSRATGADPILSSIVASRVKAIGERMGVVVERSAHSPLLVEGRDFSLGIYDQDGVLLEQTEYIPVLGYATAPAMRHIAQRFRGRVAAGDVVLHNDPFSGGNQLSDWKVAKPVFHEGEHCAWVAIIAHQADVGGAVPGSYNPHATDLWQEALRIPPVKVYEAGTLREDVWELIFSNVRLPVVADDVRAMVGACKVGERELKALVTRYGLDTFRAAVAELLDSTERSARAVIRRIPNGVYEAAWEAHDDAFDHDRVMPIRVAVTVEDERLTFDFTGTGEQTPGYVNAPLAVTLSSVMIAFFMVADQELPHNDAITRCIDVVVPEGCMLNPRFPAATGFGNHLSDQICQVIMLALAEVVPERVTAGWNPMLACIVSGWSSRARASYVDILINASKGGGGGTQGADGYDHIGLIASGGAIAAQDPELFELLSPHVLHRYEYLVDSAGAGEWRGGLGVETVFSFTDGGVQASIFGDGGSERTAATGVLGGERGCPNELELTYPDGRSLEPRLKDLVSDIPAGTVYRQIAGGGGGYGDPRARPATVVAEDVRKGYVSEEAARTSYGVVIDPITGDVDEKATTDLRGG